MAFGSIPVKISETDIFKRSLLVLRNTATCFQRLDIASKKKFFYAYTTSDGALWLNIYQKQALNAGEMPDLNIFPLLSQRRGKLPKKSNEQILFSGANPGILLYINDNILIGWKLVWREEKGKLDGFEKPFLQAVKLHAKRLPQGEKDLWNCFETRTPARERQLLLIDQYFQVLLITPDKNSIVYLPNRQLINSIKTQRSTGSILSPHNNDLLIISGKKQIIIWNWRQDQQHGTVNIAGISDICNDNFIIESLTLSEDKAYVELSVRNLFLERLQDVVSLESESSTIQKYPLGLFNLPKYSQCQLSPPHVHSFTPPRKPSSAGSSPGLSPGSFPLKFLAGDDEKTEF